MSDEKVKKSKGTIKKDTVAIIVVVLLILVYIFYECYSVSHIQLETQTALPTTIYETIDATAIIIRDEHSLINESNGVTVPTLNDGDKINVGGTVAMSFATDDEAASYSKYNQLEQEIKYYEEIESQTVGQASNVESINKEINTDIDSYIQSMSSGDIEGINESGNMVNNSLVRRQMIIGENVDLISIIQDLRTKADSYSKSTPSKYITTETSGVFSSYTDGYEQLCDYSKAEEMSVSQIENAIKTASEQKENTNNFGKLVTSYSWYLECVVDADSVKNLKNGQKLDVAFKNNSNTVLSVKIVSGAEVGLGQKKTALILECNDMNSELATLRVEDIEIRTKEYQGIKVPTGALHVVDGKKGVYALISSQVRFREAEVIYTSNDYLVLNYDVENQKGIRLYDKIILQGKDLEDGRVYT